jgi:hypothetical protein
MRGRIVVRTGTEAKMRSRTSSGRSIPGPSSRSGRLAVKHAQLVIDRVGRGRTQMVGSLLFGRGQVPQDTVD